MPTLTATLTSAQTICEIILQLPCDCIYEIVIAREYGVQLAYVNFN